MTKLLKYAGVLALSTLLVRVLGEPVRNLVFPKKRKYIGKFTQDYPTERKNYHLLRAHDLEHQIRRAA